MSVTAADLMAAPETPVQFIIEELIPHGLTVLAGSPKTGKSYLALQAALAVAQGECFLDRATDQGNVLYLALEDGSQRLQRRLHQLAPASGNLDSITFQFSANRLLEGLEADLDAWLATAKRPRLVVIDTFGRVDPKIRHNQSEYSHVTSVLGPLQGWALKHGIGVLLIHHLRKGKAEAHQSFDVFEGILGSQGMLATVDAALVVLRQRGAHTAQLHMTSRDFEEGEFALASDPETMRWAVTTLLHDPLATFTDRRREVVEVLMSGPARLKDIAARLGTTESNVIQHLTKAIRDRVVRKVERGVYALEERLAEQLAPPMPTTHGEGTELDEVAHLDFAEQSPDEEEIHF